MKLYNDKKVMEPIDTHSIDNARYQRHRRRQCRGALDALAHER